MHFNIFFHSFLLSDVCGVCECMGVDARLRAYVHTHVYVYLDVDYMLDKE